jgi:excisionase family DNA binding protein
MHSNRNAIPNGHGGLRPHGNQPTVEPLLTLPEVARLLRLSEKSIRRMVARRRLPCVRLGRSVRFDAGDVLRWLSARKEG